MEGEGGEGWGVFPVTQRGCVSTLLIEESSLVSADSVCVCVCV